MIEAESGGWADKIAALAKAGNDGEKILEAMGQDIQGALIQSINDLTSPPLAPSTIARKKFSKPLIETGHMVSSTSYRVIR